MAMLDVNYLGKRKIKGTNLHLIRVKSDKSSLVIISEGGTRIEKKNFKGDGTFAVLDIPHKKGTIKVVAGKEEVTIETE